MTDKHEKRQKLIRERGAALAVMHLTRRDDLRVTQIDEDVGLDLRVRILSSEGGLREFGVELCGAWSPIDQAHANKILTGAIRETQRYGPFFIPVCLFFFTMEETQGWYTWVAEPVVIDGRAQLKQHRKAESDPLDKHALDALVERVNLWYDARLSGEVATIR